MYPFAFLSLQNRDEAQPPSSHLSRAGHFIATFDCSTVLIQTLQLRQKPDERLLAF